MEKSLSRTIKLESNSLGEDVQQPRRQAILDLYREPHIVTNEVTIQKEFEKKNTILENRPKSTYGRRRIVDYLKP